MTRHSQCSWQGEVSAVKLHSTQASRGKAGTLRNTTAGPHPPSCCKSCMDHGMSLHAELCVCACVCDLSPRHTSSPTSLLCCIIAHTTDCRSQVGVVCLQDRGHMGQGDRRLISGRDHIHVGWLQPNLPSSKHHLPSLGGGEIIHITLPLSYFKSTTDTLTRFRHPQQ